MGRRRGVAAALALVALVAPGCGSASPPSPPAGVDELEIPTPTPDPDDFVDGVTNPWLPLNVGAVRRYKLEPGGRQVTMTVTTGPRVAGVVTTAVRSRTVSRRGPEQTVDYYAQDLAGNVWWFGRTGTAPAWRAGEDGARAGLVMPARPRVGDGFREAHVPGVLESWSRVERLDAVVRVPAGEYDGALQLETSHLLDAGRVVRSSYVRGVGLVQRETLAGTPDLRLDLVAHDEPAGG